MSISNPSLVGVIRGTGSPNYLERATSVHVVTIGVTEYAFVASFFSDALSIFDVSTPATPSLVGVISGTGNPNYLNGAFGVRVVTIGVTEYAFVASNADDALSIFDVSTPSSPSHVGVISGIGSPNYLDEPLGVDIATIGGTEYAFVASRTDNSLSIFDVSAEAPVIAIATQGWGNLADKYLSGNLL